MAYASKKKLADNSIVPFGSNLYGTCSTASATAAKIVTMPDFNVLVEGVTIHIYFANDNTASNPTLTVGTTEAKPVSGSWQAGGFASFTYYNGSWIQNDRGDGGVVSYNDLTDKPKIEGVSLEGDKTYEQLNLQRITNSELETILTL